MIDVNDQSLNFFQILAVISKIKLDVGLLESLLTTIYRIKIKFIHCYKTKLSY